MAASWAHALLCILFIKSVHCLPVGEEGQDCRSFKSETMVRSIKLSLQHLQEHPGDHPPADASNPVRGFSFEGFGFSGNYYRCYREPQLFFWMLMHDVRLNLTFPDEDMDYLYAKSISMRGAVEDDRFCDLHDSSSHCIYDRVVLNAERYNIPSDNPEALVHAAVNGLTKIVRRYLEGK